MSRAGGRSKNLGSEGGDRKRDSEKIRGQVKKEREAEAEQRAETEKTLDGAAAIYRTGVQREVDRQVERRLTGILTAAGVNFNRVAVEILYMLPPSFVEAYAEAFTQALGSADSGAQARGKGQERTADLARAQAPAHGGTGKRFKQSFVIKSEKALDVKSRADKRLRTLARDIRKGLAGELEDGVGKMRCANCTTFLADNWKFCPGCGKPRPEGVADEGS